MTITAEELSSYGGEISRQEAVAVTLETSGNDPRSDRVNALNLAWGGTLMTVDCLSLPSEAQRLLREALESPPVKVFCNAKTDLQFLIPYGINPTKYSTSHSRISFSQRMSIRAPGLRRSRGAG